MSVKEQHGETTLVVEPERAVEACTHLRDEEGFNFLSDVTGADYLGWGESGVSGYIGTPVGRDLNLPMTQGLQMLPEPKPKRFAMNYHLLSVSETPRRACASRPGSTTASPSPSVVEIWPTADWHEREAWDLMGIPIEGHPNLMRILLDEDWEGHPLRKDYPLGGEPVRFSEDR